MRPWRTAIAMPLPTGAVRIDAARCVHSRLDRSQCRACADACPEDAIALESFPALVATRCTACRRCEAACPVGAIAGDVRDLESLATELGRTPDPVLGCSVPGVDAHVSTGCLGFLEREALLALALALPGGLTLNLTRCRDCPNGAAVADLAREVDAMRHESHGIGAGNLRAATAPGELDFRGNAVSRRQFFAFAAKRFAAAAAPSQPTATTQVDGRTKNVPSRRRLLLKNLQRIPAQRRAPIEAALFPVLAFGPACNDCMACVGMCPTGAIVTSRDDPPRPEFIASRCTDCGLCVEFCAVKAITLSPAREPGLATKPGPLPARAVS